VKITADTNLLVRLATGDDPAQLRAAVAALADAEMIVIPSIVLCELAWVLGAGYRLPAARVAGFFRDLAGRADVVVDRVALADGLAQLENGGDFADGAIASAGRALGGDVFVSFDREAVRILEAQGRRAALLAGAD